jgi:hypothetical protein
LYLPPDTPTIAHLREVTDLTLLRGMSSSGGQNSGPF